MYNIRRDIKYEFDDRTETFISVDFDKVKTALAGLTLKDVIRKQGYFVTDVYREMRTTLFGEYPVLLDYCKCRKPMENEYCQNLNVWQDIRQACNRMAIIWEGWNDLPDLPDDDF